MQATPGRTTTDELQARRAEGALAGDWVLDPVRSTVVMKTKVMGLIPVNGVFREVNGAGTVSPDGGVSGTLVVATASIDTQNVRRDEHLRSADLLASGQHPAITFTADRIETGGGNAAVTGMLTVAGTSRPLHFDAVPSVTGQNQIRLDAEVEINRADFGLSWNVLGMASMRNIITIRATFTRR